MRIAERDRRELIKKLQKIKDPRERDRIIWLLAGHQESVSRGDQPVATLPRFEPASSRKPVQPMPAKAQESADRPPLAIGPGRMLRFVFPGFFAVFGLVRIGQALLNYMESRQIEPEITSLFTGGIFLIIGLAGIFRAMRPTQINKDEVS